jgi:hypothetical protein
MQLQTRQFAAAVFAAAAAAGGGEWPLLLLLPLAAKVAATPFPAAGCYLLLVGGGTARVACFLEHNSLVNKLDERFAGQRRCNGTGGGGTSRRRFTENPPGSSSPFSLACSEFLLFWPWIGTCGDGTNTECAARSLWP